jgi:hypothetical protein
MSTFKQNEPIILAVARNDKDLTLRIDQNSWAFDSFEGLPVVELKLTGCRSAARLYDGEIDSENAPLGEVLAELTNSVDLALYYEIVKEVDEFVISLQVNYLADGLRLYCTQISETPSDYTTEDLKRKTTRFAQLYQASAQANQLNDYMYRLLKDSLEKMISKEFDLYQRKIEFFSRTHPKKATILTGEIQAYQNVLACMGLGETDGKPLESQVRVWLGSMEFDDGYIENQSAHAKSIENKIANFGQAALFPLLEMIKYAHPGFRREVIIILGMIDPSVQKRVADILQFDEAK